MFNPGNSNAEDVARSFFRNDRVRNAMDWDEVDDAIDFFVDNNLVLDIVSS